MNRSIIDDQRTSAVQLGAEELQRYSRHLIMPEVTADGQRRLKAARVLCIGAGGLGSPAALYLTAAGVGTIGIVDFDDVDLSNLQRQILHGTKDVGRGKLESAHDRLRDINPKIEIELYQCRLSSENASEIVSKYDIVVDGSENFGSSICGATLNVRFAVRIEQSLHRLITINFAEHPPMTPCRRYPSTN